MKILILDSMPFLYPEDVDSLEEFMDYANQNFHSFVPLYQVNTKHCVYPYFVEEEATVRYVNLSRVVSFVEDEVEMLPTRHEYDERLKEVLQGVCTNCQMYLKGMVCDQIEGREDEMRLGGGYCIEGQGQGHMYEVRLDGYCPYFMSLDDDDYEYEYDGEEDDY